MNKVVLFGNLGADPEFRVAQSGQEILKLRVATTERYLDKGGAQQEKTEWHSVTLFGKRAQPLSKLLRKGEKVLVEGRVSTSSYEKDGEKRYTTEVVAHDIEFGGGKRAPADDDIPC